MVATTVVAAAATDTTTSTIRGSGGGDRYNDKYNSNGRRRASSSSSAVRSILYASIASALVYDIHLHVIYSSRDGVFDSGIIAYFERATQDVLMIRRGTAGSAVVNNISNNDNSDNKEESESSPVSGSGSNSSTSNSNNHDTTSSSSSSNSIAFHFPTVEERVRYYMGSWYDRKYNESSGDNNRNSAVLDEEALCKDVPYYDPNLGLRWWDLVHIFEKKTVLENIPPNSERYFPDVWNHVFRHADEMMEGTMREDFKAIALFGDTMSSLRVPLNYPIMFKARLAESPKYTRGVDNPPKYTPILAMLETARHYRDPLSALDNLPEELVTPWERKMNTLLWRGATSGSKRARIRFVGRYYNYNETGDGNNTTDKLVDVGFTTRVNGVPITRQLHQLMKAKLNYAEQLNYKYLLSLEGNDVATGLKWMLYSNSVVFMAHPVTRVSWAMEDRLVPFYHFVPLKPDLSNLLEMITWARANDEECKRISKRATEYVKALYATEEAKKTNDIINRKIVRRYHALYGPALAKCDRNRNNSYVMACDNVTAGNGPYRGPFVDLDPCRDYTPTKKKT